MKNNKWIILLFIFQAIPLPFSLMSVLGSLISIANFSMVDDYRTVVIPITAMILAATYLFPYLISLFFTVEKGKIHVCSFLPIMHLAITALFLLLWYFQ